MISEQWIEKHMDGCGSSFIEGIIKTTALEGLKKTDNNSVRIFTAPAKLKTRHLLSLSLKHYRSSQFDQ
jgi:hypothetical protein